MGITPENSEDYTRFKVKTHALEFRHKQHSLEKCRNGGEREMGNVERLSDPLPVHRSPALDHHQASSPLAAGALPVSGVAADGSEPSGLWTFSASGEASGTGSETVSAREDA